MLRVLARSLQPTRVLLLLIVLQSLPGNSQESDDYKKFKENVDYREAYIVDKSGNKVAGLIKNKDDIQSTAMVFIPIDGEKRAYYPQDIIEFGFTNAKYVSVGELFLEVVKEGRKVSLCRTLAMNHRHQPGAAGGTGSVHAYQAEDYFVKKPNEQGYTQVKRNFKKTFAEYFGDCEILKRKIEREELTSKDINKIVDRYNWECK
jgi:hypothetical protein